MKRVRNATVWKHLKVNRRLRQGDLNIRPIMNLFMVLVPFLLMYSSFVELSILHSAVSEQGGRSSDEIRPGLIVEVNDAGYALLSHTCNLQKLLDAQEKVVGESRLTIAGFDRQQLAKLLVGIKQHFPKETEISLVPRRNNDYQEVIRLMDAVREFRDGNTIKPLFPNIAFLQPPALAKPAGVKNEVKQP